MRYQTPVPLEEQEQTTLFDWAALQARTVPELRLLYAIPNGGKRPITEAARFKKAGVRAGVPDIHLPVARGTYHGLYIEMKRTRGGRVSDAQNEWIDALRAQGYRCEVCMGWEAAAAVLRDYLDIRTP